MKKLLVLSIFLVGCCSPLTVSDFNTLQSKYKKVKKDYNNYVDNDSKLSDLDKKARKSRAEEVDRTFDSMKEAVK